LDRSAAGLSGPFANRGRTRRYSLHTIAKGSGSMDAVMNFLSNWYVMGGMLAALLILIGLMIFLRMKPRDEE
jgi:hypothetical protein